MLTRTKHNYFNLYFTGMAFQMTGLARNSLPAYGKVGNRPWRPSLTKAMALTAAEAAVSMSLERHVLRKIQGEGVTIKTYTEGEVGW
jgi:hypothetical protein